MNKIYEDCFRTNLGEVSEFNPDLLLLKKSQTAVGVSHKFNVQGELSLTKNDNQSKKNMAPEVKEEPITYAYLKKPTHFFQLPVILKDDQHYESLMTPFKKVYDEKEIKNLNSLHFTLFVFGFEESLIDKAKKCFSQVVVEWHRMHSEKLKTITLTQLCSFPNSNIVYLDADWSKEQLESIEILLNELVNAFIENDIIGETGSESYKEFLHQSHLYSCNEHKNWLKFNQLHCTVIRANTKLSRTVDLQVSIPATLTTPLMCQIYGGSINNPFFYICV